jgi:hypothetical protein
MTDRPVILWRWKNSLGKFTRGLVGQESRYLILISGEWYLKEDIEIKGYDYGVRE